ncbi:MAG: hypothetical protein ACSLE8_06365 [Rhodococcus sp. (in: high G+C Gram-positive bacteria)]
MSYDTVQAIAGIIAFIAVLRAGASGYYYVWGKPGIKGDGKLLTQAGISIAVALVLYDMWKQAKEEIRLRTQQARMRGLTA